MVPRLPLAPASASPAAAEPAPDRAAVPDRFKWELADIFPDEQAWEEALHRFEARMDDLAALEGTLHQGPEHLLEALRLEDELGEVAYKVWYYPALAYDQDQRDNQANARRQRVQILFARWRQVTAWVNPELLALPWEEVDGWMRRHPGLEHFRFKLEDLFRQSAHVLGEAEERLLSLGSRLGEVPDDSYSALSTADIVYPTVELSDGRSVQVTYGRYRSLLVGERRQEDRRRIFEAFYRTFAGTANTYAALYNGVCQRDWFVARARRYPTTLEAALDANAIPPSVVEGLIAATREGTAPLRRYHRLRQRVLGLHRYHLYDTSLPLVDLDPRFPWEEATTLVYGAFAPLGDGIQRRVEEAFAGRWVDVFENEGKRSGAYSAAVYGVHPYMLLNYNATLDDLFTVVHETGHTVHTLLSHESQPFTYAAYTVFVAEVASTTAEALLLDHLLARKPGPEERITLLQHAIDSVLGTFYTQVLFAEWELEAHRMVERGEPITAEALSALYRRLLDDYYGDAVTVDDLYRITWTRIPHFFHSPYYVYQYATAFAASARIVEQLREAGEAGTRREVVDRYLRLLRSGGSAYPMDQLAEAGVDLLDGRTVRAVVHELDRLVAELESAVRSLSE